MPAPRAVLTDLEASGLNPLKAHSDISDNGHLKSATIVVPKKVGEPVEKAPEPPKAEKKATKPAADKSAEVVAKEEPARRMPRRPKPKKDDD